MTTKLLIAGFVAALTTSFAAAAADLPATAGKAEAAPAAKPGVKSHYHPEANKQQGPAPEKKAAAPASRKPLHDHRKEHKQQ